MTFSKGTFTLSNGVEFRANHGLLCPEIDSLAEFTNALGEGYDGHVSIIGDDWERSFTADERREIADYMIARWTAWRDGGPIV